MATNVATAMAVVVHTVMVTIMAAAAAIEESAVEAGGVVATKSAVFTVGLRTTLLWCILRWFL